MSSDCLGPRSMAGDDGDNTIDVFSTDFIFLFFFHLNMVFTLFTLFTPLCLYTSNQPIPVNTCEQCEHFLGKKRLYRESCKENSLDITCG